MQGLEKVMPQPVTREKQDTQVCCLMDKDRALMSRVSPAMQMPLDQCWDLPWFGCHQVLSREQVPMTC